MTQIEPMKCENCGQKQMHPDYLWRKVHYDKDGSFTFRVVCPSCYTWADAHPEQARCRKEG